MFNRVRPAIASAAVAVLLWAAPPLRAQGNPVQLDLPAQSLAKSLRAVATAANTNVLFDTAQISSRTAPALKGKVTVDEALSKLLAGSGLRFRYLDDKTIVLAVAEQGALAGENPADQMRLAALAEAADARASAADEARDPQQMTVEGSREKAAPFAGANVDIPRTIDDAQPYFIFDARTLERSGALNVEDFLKQYLTMNATAETNSQSGQNNLDGTTSTINLRGLGQDKTLILVNGRRLPGRVAGRDASSVQQADLNGIPLGSIERIEVLPTSASGIYGGSAIGGVVNVVLKRDYSGGDVRLGYDNTFDTDAPRRSASLNYGASFLEGRTRTSVSASWSDAEPLLLGDRRELNDRGVAAVLRNNPASLYSSSRSWLGSLPNFRPQAPAQSTLTLDNTLVLPARTTYLPAGTSAGTPRPAIYAGLAANAGQMNMDLPPTTQPGGLLRPMGAAPRTLSLMGSLGHRFGSAVEIYLDYMHTENDSTNVFNTLRDISLVPGSPSNPFTTNVVITLPSAADARIDTKTSVESVTGGLMARLPRGWQAQLDYTYSKSRYSYLEAKFDSSAITADANSGALDVLVDSLANPPDLSKYTYSGDFSSAVSLRDAALRASGPLWPLPWGTPALTVGVERRTVAIPQMVRIEPLPVTLSQYVVTTYFPRDTVTGSGYAELLAPLVKQHRYPLLHELELQLSGRKEHNEVDTGTIARAEYPYADRVFLTGPSRDGEPYFEKARYSSSNTTVGIRYQPVAQMTLRASRATAFLPTLPEQLVKNPYTLPDSDTVDDVLVTTVGGGNPDLKPQHSRSTNLGIILEPSWKPLRGLRLNAERYRIEQFDAIGYLSAQQIADQENLYPGRITRDGNGVITLVDISMVNLYLRDTRGWDFSADYPFRTARGTFNLRVAQSMIDALKTQFAQSEPAYDALGFPSEGGAVKRKGNLALTWEWQGWSAGWTASHVGSYKQYGAVGGPSATQRAATGLTPSLRLPVTTYTAPQGSDTIPSQSYHDLFVSRVFDDGPGAGVLAGMAFQLSVRNVFGSLPPYDYYYGYYTSPFGSTRLRSYAISVRKTF